MSLLPLPFFEHQACFRAATKLIFLDRNDI